MRAGRPSPAAESCTGGWIAKSLTDIAGSSACFGYGFVSYSNEAKHELLNVAAATLATHGAVSEAVVREMAEGALRSFRRGSRRGGQRHRRPGRRQRRQAGRHRLVRVGGEAARADTDTTTRECFDGDRDAVRSQTVITRCEARPSTTPT